MWTCPKCGERIEDQFDSCWRCAGQTPGLPAARPMNRGFSWLLMIVILFAQLLISANLYPGATNLAKIAYRRDERIAAYNRFVKDRSPENKSALDDEWK